MWMVGYNEGGEFNMADYPFNGGSRKLRPLMPRPVVVTSPNNTSTSTNTNNTPCLTRIHHHAAAAGNDFFSQYHNNLVGEQGKRELNTTSPPVVVSSRWNPTPEQLRALEELYRRGTRTPSAEQIQQITAQLRRFGKIEGKNVFYWFQNHKARERQKRRRQMESATDEGHPPDFDTTLEKHKDLGASKTVREVEQTKNWVPSTNCSTLAEESVSIQRAAKAAVAECRTDGWVQFDELGSELQQRRNYFMERNATWHMMQFSCPNLNPIVTSTTSMMPTSTTVVTSNAARAMDPKFIKTHDLSFFISPHTPPNGGFIHLSTINSEDDDNNNNNNNNNSVESHHQTLQLFPIRNGDGNSGDIDQHKETEISASEMNAPSQFFEFLPLKN